MIIGFIIAVLWACAVLFMYFINGWHIDHNSINQWRLNWDNFVDTWITPLFNGFRSLYNFIVEVIENITDFIEKILELLN